MIHAYNQCYDIEYAIVRFSNVYGKYDYSDRVVPLFISKALNNEDIRIFGRDKILDFTYVEDAVGGLIRILDIFEIARNELYNIATQKGYSIDQVARKIIELTGSKSQIIYETNRTGEVCRFVADITKARAVLDYHPQYDLTGGLEETVKWYQPRIKEYAEQLDALPVCI